MGKRGTASQKSKKAAAEVFSMPFMRPLPPAKRNELNKIVDKLLVVTSNLADEPVTPQQMYDEYVTLSALVAQVQELEKCNLNRPLVGSRLSHVATLLSWLEQHGAVIKGVQVQQLQDGELGLKVTNPLKVGDVVIRIPEKALMSVDTARDSEIGRLIEHDPMLQSMNNVALALHLLLEKTSPASFWEPYINTLPHAYTTVLYFSPEDFQALRGSVAFEDALKQYKNVARQYAYFYKKFQSTMLKDYFTYDEYRWAVSTVMTRQNEVPSRHDSNVCVNTLIPFWDFANHDDGTLSTDYDDEEHAVKCMANRDFQVGEPFTIFYGVRGNHDLLVHNGFVPERNACNAVALRLGVSKNDAVGGVRCEILRRLGIAPQGLFLVGRNHELPVDVTMMAFLRVLCMSPGSELEHWSAAQEQELAKLLEESAADLDSKAYTYLLTRCQLLLKAFPTSLEEDSALAKEASQSRIRLYCIRLRMQEKEILGNVIKYCQSKVSK